MWVVKAKGETYYVNHVECELPWSTKETPDNEATKGSIKIKRCHLVIDSENTAHIRKLTPEIEARLSKPETIIRVMTAARASLRDAIDGLEHGPIKSIGGGCSTLFYITEFTSEEEFVMFKLRMNPSASWRELKPNEDYYRDYGKFKDSKQEHIYDEDDDDDDYDDYDEDEEVPAAVNFTGGSYEDLYEA